jgi:hypothetical protein
MSSLILNLADLQLGMAGLTPARGQSFAEAAAVCLEQCAHESSVECAITGFSPQVGELHWEAVDDQQRNTNADLQDATEDGAAGVAILAMSALTGLTVRERAIKNTGVDYWLGDDGASDDDLPFQNLTRLEISGILTSSPQNTVDRRVAQKLAQTDPTDAVAPAYVAVVEFSQPRIHVEAK